MATTYATARALERRYPGVSVEITWLDQETYSDWDGTPAYKGWLISYTAPAAGPLIERGLATPAEFESGNFRPDEFGHSRHGSALIDDRCNYRVTMHIPDFIPDGFWTEKRVHTKKVQREVSRCLKRAFALPRRSETRS